MKLLLLKSLALGYILPSSILLHQMTVQRSAQLAQSFEVAGTLTLSGDEAGKAAAELGLAAQEPLSVPARFSFAAGKCTLDLHGDARGAKHVTATNDRGQISPTDASAPAWLVRLGCLPFLFHGEGGEASLEAVMRKAGGRFDEAALTLANGELAYVLGAGEEGTGKTGLVVQKRGYTALRIWEDEGGSRVEVSFRDYQLAFHEGGFPTVIDLRAGGKTVARFAAAAQSP